jgi:Undecaprenyl-phosphate glucose phosphotransferase
MHASATQRSSLTGLKPPKRTAAAGGSQPFRVRLNLYTFYLRILTYSAPLWSFLIAMAISLDIHGHVWRDIKWHEYLRLLLVVSGAWAISVERLRLTLVSELLEGYNRVRHVLAACCLSYGVALIVVFFARLGNYSRIFTASSFVMLWVVTVAIRLGTRLLIRRAHRLHGTHRVLIVGSDEFAQRTAASVSHGPLGPTEIVGFVRLVNQEVETDTAPVYQLADLHEPDEAGDFDEVIIAIAPATFSQLENILPLFEPMCVPVRIVLDFGKQIALREKLFQIGGLQLLDLATTPAESVPYLILKRGFDVVFASLAIFLTAPVMLAIAIGVKLSSPGPVFFLQERVGLNGNTFRMLKFRTMRIQENRASDTVWTTQADPRRTAFGAFLRKTSLDELPQFFNVLDGSMSVVGPRPERPYFVSKFRDAYDHYDKRHYLKAGITGWAQVNGYRGDTSIEKRVEYDLYYLENWSLMLDVKIIALTFVSGLMNRNAY